MLNPFRRLAGFSGSSKGAKIVLAAWLVVVIAISMFAPSSKDYEVNSLEGSVKGNKASEIAEEVIKRTISK